MASFVSDWLANSGITDRNDISQRMAAMRAQDLLDCRPTLSPIPVPGATTAGMMKTMARAMRAFHEGQTQPLQFGPRA